MDKTTILLSEYEEIRELRTIGKRIAVYRKMRNMTQNVLAQKANISKSYLSKIEASGSKVTFSIDVFLSLSHCHCARDRNTSIIVTLRAC